MRLEQLKNDPICKSRTHCVACRSRHGGVKIREALSQQYDLPLEFDCPFGAAWVEDKPLKRAWKEVAVNWKQAGEYAKAKASKAAVAMGLLEPVSLELRQLRQYACHGDVSKGAAPCQYRRFSPQKNYHYCGACGCPAAAEDARISGFGSQIHLPILDEETDDKYSHPYLACPINKPGFSGTKKHIVIRQEEGLGDATVLSAVLRDLHLSYPDEYSIEFRGWTSPIFYGCPHVDYATHTVKRGNLGENVIECYLDEFPNTHGHIQDILNRKLSQTIGKPIKVSQYGGDLRLLPEEIEAAKALPFSGEKYVILNPGSKQTPGAITVKQPNPEELAKVVAHFLGRVLFVQVGGQYAYNPEIPGVYDCVEKRGENTLRKAMIAMYGAIGTVGPISWPMHLVHALNLPPEKAPRWSVVLAGGRERPSLVSYPNQTIIDKIGKYDCCKSDACYKTNTEKDCLLPVSLPSVPFRVAKCMKETTAAEIIEAIEFYVGV